MSSICSILAEALSEVAEKPLFVFPESRWNAEEVVTYAGLASASAGAAQIISEYARPGARALLMFPAGPAFWEAFIGCLACRVVAVPLSVPNLNRDPSAFQELWQDCEPSVILTDEATAEQFRRHVDQFPWLGAVPIITPAQWHGASCSFRFDAASDEELAFLQYTSGSTARPKGVQISHGNLLANLKLIQRRMGIRMLNDAGVTWLPHHHDMGLIGSHLATLFTRNTTWCLRPQEFILRPARWLQLISEHRASVCGGPDFAYRLCVEQITDEQITDLDLSSWRIAYVGAERIRAETIGRFQDRFGARGFRRNAFFPCYGLGEATLMVTGGPPEAEPVIRSVSSVGLRANRLETPAAAEELVSLVGSGQIGEGCHVVIVDVATGNSLVDDRIGEICVSGPSVTSGYFRRNELNDRLFLKLMIDERFDLFLRTGDLGFQSGGELFVTGRLKELMIIRGRNLSPEDVELSIVDAHDAMQPAGQVAFSIDENGQESLIIVCELRRSAVKNPDHAEIVSAIRRKTIEGVGVNPAKIVLVRPASVPRTSSGKLKRFEVRDSFLDGTIGQKIFCG